MKSINYPIDLLLVSLSGVYIGHKITKDIFIFGEEIGGPIFWMSISLSIISFLLLFVDRKIFFGWLKFGAFFFIISIIFFVLVPSGSCNGLQLFLCHERSELSFYFSSVLLILSVIIILYKHFKLHGKTNYPNSNIIH